MLLAALAVVAAVTAAPIPAAPERWAEDHAGFISSETRDALDAKLQAYERATGHQVVVWIGKTIGGAPLDDWAVRTFAAWKLGRKGVDDGVAMFILADDRKIDIEVGYGLEDKLPDAIASRIIREVMAPRLRANDRDGAVTAGVDAVLAAIEGHPWNATGEPAQPRPGPSWPELVGGGVLVLLALFLFIRHPVAAMWILGSIFGRGGRGGGGFGGDGGGFGGGGGRSGGGGARGGW